MPSKTDHELLTDMIKELNLRLDDLVLRFEDLAWRVDKSDPGVHYFIPPSERPGLAQADQPHRHKNLLFPE